MNKPIVDTDIWVFLVSSGYYKRLIKYYQHLNFSDVVEKEIMKWERNQGTSSKIATIFLEMKRSDKVKIISFEDFDATDRLSIQHQLSEYGLKSIKIAEKNKGEFVSMLYALHKDISRMKTNDRHFTLEIGDKITQQLTIVNWDDILDNYSTTIEEKTEARKVVQYDQEKMKKEKPQQQDPRWDKLRGLLG